MFGCPFFNTHFLNHTEVVNFQRMRHPFGAVGNGLQAFAWKFVALETKIHLFFLNTGVHPAIRVNTQNLKSRTIPVVRAATFAPEFVFRNIVPFEKGFPVFPVFFCNAKRAIETIFATRCCQKLVVHLVFFDLKVETTTGVLDFFWLNDEKRGLDEICEKVKIELYFRRQFVGCSKTLLQASQILQEIN